MFFHPLHPNAADSLSSACSLPAAILAYPYFPICVIYRCSPVPTYRPRSAGLPAQTSPPAAHGAQAFRGMGRATGVCQLLKQRRLGLSQDRLDLRHQGVLRSEDMSSTAGPNGMGRGGTRSRTAALFANGATHSCNLSEAPLSHQASPVTVLRCFVGV